MTPAWKEFEPESYISSHRILFDSGLIMTHRRLFGVTVMHVSS